jgi:hypothetical protein
MACAKGEGRRWSGALRLAARMGVWVRPTTTMRLQGGGGWAGLGSTHGSGNTPIPTLSPSSVLGDDRKYGSNILVT